MKCQYWSCGTHSQPHNKFACTAAVPTVDNTRRHRYITFLTPDSVREIILSCPIRPGPLSDSQYSVEWISRHPGSDGSTVINTKDYDIIEDISPSSSQYQCLVTIQHYSDQETVYNDTIITIESLGKLH